MRTVITLALLLFMIPVFSTVRNVPATYATVQSALNACAAGDTVLVLPGTYTGNITWPSIMAIKLFSAGDSSNTTLTANNSGRVLTISFSGLDTNTIIRGFTIKGGFLSTNSSYGAGVNVSSGSVKFDRVAIKGNRSFAPGGYGYGAGVYLSNSNSVFRNSSLRLNSVDSAQWCYGGGVYITGGAPRFYDCTISSNRMNSSSWCYGFGAYVNNSNAIFRNVKLMDNTSGAAAIWYYGGGLYINGGTSNYINILVSGNRLNSGGNFYYGGGIFVDGGSTTANFFNCTVAENQRNDGGSLNGTGIYIRNAAADFTNIVSWNNTTGTEFGNNAGTVNVTYSCIRGGYFGTGNISNNPLFVSTTDFHLTQASPCLGAGTPVGAPANDLDNNPRPMPVATNPDMGAYELNQTPLSTTESFISGISIFPNPAREQVFITNLSPGTTITVYTMLGVLVKSEMYQGNAVYALDLSGFSPGRYIVLVSSEGKVETLNFVKTE